MAILCPLQNTSKMENGIWVQVRPHITQKFGENPQVYRQFGMDGHNGLDLRAKEGSPLFSPIEGVASIGNQGDNGYGKFIIIKKDNLSVTIAHLSEFKIVDGQKVYMGQLIGLTGNTGFSTAPHLHVTVKKYVNDKLLDANNGYNGAIDWTELGITFKGSLKKNLLE